MKKPSVLPGPFRRFQWRLTLSYTLVTVAALVVVELALFALLLVLLNTDFLTQEIVSTVEDGFVPQASNYLDSTPPDLEGLNTWLQSAADDSIAADSQGRRFTRGLSIQIDQDFQLYVVDPGGQLLAQAQRGHSPASLAESFDVTAVPHLEPLLTAALAGESIIERLYTTTPDGTLVMALPIEGQTGELMGALVVTTPIPAFNLQTLGSIAVLVLISVIPFTLAAGLIGAVFGFLTSRGLTRRLESLSNSADAWSRGDFSVMAIDRSADELGQLSHRLNLMAEQLQNLMQSHQELAGIQERNRLARELHDSVKQQVFATTMQVGTAQALLPDDPEAAAEHLAEAEKLSRQSQEELAMLIQELRPAALERDGLAEALETYATDWSRQSGIEAWVRVQGKRPLPLAVEQALFRVTQEALSNVARHSGASLVNVTLTYEDVGVSLTLNDDGHGFDPSQAVDQGYGLQSMRERVEGLGGRLQIDSEPDSGAKVVAKIPVNIEEL
jgi:NarL family two-component system sensor histidine kinase LiaS